LTLLSILRHHFVFAHNYLQPDAEGVQAR